MKVFTCKGKIKVVIVKQARYDAVAMEIDEERKSLLIRDLLVCDLVAIRDTINLHLEEEE
jgi:hypothetical protein